MHAFHLVEDKTYLEIAGHGLGKTYAGPEFINFLLRNSALAAREPELVITGDRIIYFDKGQFRHVGRVIAHNRILSKWGTGNLYQHAVWEVPASYGDDVRYYIGPGEHASFELFLSYAESKGFAFEP